MTTPIPRRLAAALVALGLLAAACGDDGDDGATATTDAAPATTTAPTTAAPTTAAPATTAPTTVAPTTAAPPPPPTANLTDGCVETHVEGHDYFPDKTEILDTDRLSVSYEGNYKIVTVSDVNFDGDAFTYVLTQCGTPRPEATGDLADAVFVDVPVSSAVVMSTTILPGLDAIDRLDVLAGLDSTLFVSNANVRTLIDGGLRATGSLGFDFDAEVMADIDPELVLTFVFGPATDLKPIQDLDIPVAVSADYREETPLGRAEWMKLAPLFLNEEAAITEFYDQVAGDYRAAVELAAGGENAPTVLIDKSSDGTWFAPGGESFAARLVADAGGDYVFADTEGSGSLSLDVETVIAEGSEAELWLSPGFGITSLADLEAADARHTAIAAFAGGAVWNNDLATNANGGNDIFEQGVARPDLVLADLIAIIQPDLLADHEFVFFRQLS